MTSQVYLGVCSPKPKPKGGGNRGGEYGIVCRRRPCDVGLGALALDPKAYPRNRDNIVVELKREETITAEGLVQKFVCQRRSFIPTLLFPSDYVLTANIPRISATDYSTYAVGALLTVSTVTRMKPGQCPG